MSRFGQASKIELQKKRLLLNAKKTLDANKGAANVLKQYLSEKSYDENFESFDPVKLDEVLSHFYIDARRVDGDHYKANTMESLRYGINRYLKNPPFNCKFDIIKDPQFNDSNENFKSAMAELKRIGKGDTDHYPVITESDRAKLYQSLDLSPNTPAGLFNKVQFDIRLYFCRRGNENMHQMTKSTFQLCKDPNTGLRYVKKVQDELTKNHREKDREPSSGVMPESPGSIYCAVASFEKYVNRLHPENDRLWQRPRDSFVESDTVWYCNTAVGEKTLKTFMPNLSAACELDQTYVNHSIRATGATILSKNMFGAAQIMAVTGHKSVQSLAVYQRVSDEEKLQMGRTLSENIAPGENTSPALPNVLQRPAICEKSEPLREMPLVPAVANSISQYLEDVDMEEIFSNFSADTQTSITNTFSQNTGIPQVFKDCSVTIIHNITVNK